VQFILDFNWVSKLSTSLAMSPHAFKRLLLLSGPFAGYFLIAVGCFMAKPQTSARRSFSLVRANAHIKIALALLISPVLAALLYKTSYNLTRQPINEETKSALMSLTYELAARALRDEKIDFFPAPLRVDTTCSPSGQFKYPRKMTSLGLLVPGATPSDKTTEQAVKKKIQALAEVISLNHDYADGRTRNISLAGFDLHFGTRTNKSDIWAIMVVPTRIQIKEALPALWQLGGPEVLKD